MKEINELLKDWNQECKFTENIEVSKLDEGRVISREEKEKKYKGLVECILMKYDHQLLTIKENSSIELRKRIMELCSIVESDKYEEYNFNKKVLKRERLQKGLLLSLENKNKLSSLIYLIELFKINFIIISGENKYEVCLKDYEKDYICYENNKFSFISEPDIEKEEKILSIIEDDLGKGLLYDVEMKPLSKYKLDEIIKLAEENNIPVKENGKKRTKKEIYDLIYKKMIL